jgi:hypothetical protein
MNGAVHNLPEEKIPLVESNSEGSKIYEQLRDGVRPQQGI